MEHTPTPWEQWKSEEHEKFGPLVYITAQIPESKLDGVPAIATWRDMDTAKANADFIVRAVNSHEELMEACKKALHPLRYLAAHGELPEGAMPSHLPVTELIAAIAKAKGK